MAFENSDVEPGMEEAGPPPEESSNRTFLIVAAILGGIMLLSLLCVAGYALVIYPQRQSSKQTDIARSTAAAIAFQQTSEAQKWTATPTKAKPTNTPLPPTNTPVVKIATNTPITPDVRTATVAALQTQAAAAQKTPTISTTPKLPTSGFADQVGIPGMLGLAIVLVVVIFLARRLRTAS